MDRTCSTCRYRALPVEAPPCSKCSDHNRWAFPIDDMGDPSEKLSALYEVIMYLNLEVTELREKLDELMEEIRR